MKPIQVLKPGQQVHLLCVSFLVALGTVVPAAAVTEFRLGGDSGTPWTEALSVTGGGFYVALDSDGQLLRQVNVRATPRGGGVDTLIDYSNQSLQPRFVESSVNLALTDLSSDPKKVPLIWSGGKVEATNLYCPNLAQQTPLIKKMHDGDPMTAMFRGFTQDLERPPGYGEGFASVNMPSSIVLDLGAAVPMNRIRFYPRLGREEDRLLIEEFRDPKPDPESFGDDSFAGNFVAWYDIQVGDNQPVFRAGLCDAVGEVRGLDWVRPTDPQLELLKSTRENLDVVVDLRFPTRSTRWVNLRPRPLRNWEIAELEVYGEGFVERTVYTTQILDFERDINWGKLRWSGDLPAGTRVEIRTRTGSTPDPNVYLAENTNGELRPISYSDYVRIDVSGRLPPGYDSEHWSFWSPPYDFEAGLRDEDLPSSAWLDGTSMLSPGPSRYVQIDIRLFSTFTAAPRLDQLSIQLAEAPSAQQLVGEIWPIETETFDPVTFTYIVVPTFQPEDIGFDRLEILTPTRVDTLRAVRLNGTDLDLTAYPPELQDDRIVVAFPRLVGSADSFKRVEVVFDTAVLRFGTEFRGWVFNSAEESPVRQSVAPGNATFRFSGDVLSVRTPIGGDLMRHVEASPSVFTPNGDGHNDLLTFGFQLREVATPSPVTIRLYDLAGHLVHQFPSLTLLSGQFEQTWDGLDDSGRLLPPGTYLFEFTLHAEQQERQTGTFALAY
jgi:gliding motility-associated-like protein